MKIALGVTGCIGAYKAVLVLRHLQEMGAEVEVVMTRHASEFIQPLTFQALSGHNVVTDMFAPTERSDIYHITLAQAIDLMVVAPATANSIAKFARGIADDFLTTLYLSTPAPLLIAPAMNVEMLNHPATQENLAILRNRGVEFINPSSGYLACGMVGEGRLAEPLEIAKRAIEIIKEKSTKLDLVGEHLLVTAGPTREHMDPIRYISNRSSGKMGYAIAQAAINRGAEVTLVSGPVSITAPKKVNLIKITSAAEMYKAVLDNFEKATIVIKSAAVCDYHPKEKAEQKVKKTDSDMVIELERTEDILASLGKIKTHQILVGFAAETQNVLEYAKSKLVKKNIDMIVANDVSAIDAGFDTDTNRVIIIDRLNQTHLPLMSKSEVANKILDKVKELNLENKLNKS
ncbi:MAG: bifunctional phosphopantothenoylcysteine decarboxylase/phosphopantothenate--cysteine ligase CoaBC [Acidobacteria bacterium]|nr:bifunctional phosphopantothenoylcysteine decarboxylase/phosphopantothenate--cysteine ligase CoaBC [Acidobacteriota bacterium]